jgi:SAM-dependent methyltransferase
MSEPKLASPSALHADPAAPGWHRFTAAAAEGDDAPATTVRYGADLPTEAELRLLGPIEGRRIIDLGCGSGRAAVTFAHQGAKVIAVDPSTDRLAEARKRAEQEHVRIELHQADLAALAFLRADTVDAVFSAFALAEVPDLNRVFRQVHRVLRPEAPIVFSLPHPAFTMLDPTADDPLRIVRAYDDATPMPWTSPGGAALDQRRTISEIFTSLTRNNFKVDTLLEPTAPRSGRRSEWFSDVMRLVPATILLRARKQGT